MADEQEMVYEGVAREMKFKIKGKDKTTSYTLRGIGGEERATYINFLNTKMEFKEDGTPKGISGAGDLEMTLLDYCLFDEAGVLPVTRAVFGKWPAATIRSLIAKAGEFSGMGAEAAEQAKND